MDYSQLVKVYLKIRDKRAENKREFDAADALLREKQDTIEGALLQFLNNNKVDSSKTDAGTFYRQEDIVPSGSDWQAFYRWVAENDAFDALERRIKKTFVADWMAEHDNTPPPGVSVYRQYKVRVRKPA